jgi:hypothetical protein
MGTPSTVGCQVATVVSAIRFSMFRLKGERTVYQPYEVENRVLHDRKRRIEVRLSGVRYLKSILSFRGHVAAEAP